MWLVPCRRQALLPHIPSHLESITRVGSSPPSACLVEVPVYFKSTIAGIVESSTKSHGLWKTVPKRLGRSRKTEECRHPF